MLPFMPRLIRAILPNLAHHALIIQEDAIRANRALMAVVQRLPSHILSVPAQQGSEKTPSVRAGSVSGSPAASRHPTLPKEAMSPTFSSEAELPGNASTPASERAAFVSRQRATTVPATDQLQQAAPIVRWGFCGSRKSFTVAFINRSERRANCEYKPNRAVTIATADPISDTSRSRSV